MWELKQLSPEEYDRFRAFIYRQTGIAVPEGKVTLLSNRVRRRLRAHGLDSFDEYYQLLSGGLPGELERFIDAVTTNETSFFRTDSHFDWFAGPFLDELLARPRPAGTPLLRVWSAACSSGEEAYTLAICLAENRRRLAGWCWEILGTDISETALAAARQASYPRRSIEAVPPAALERHFTAAPDGTTWTVKPEVAAACRFRRHNLMEPVAGGPFDCIFIRNVLIYFDRTSKEIVVGHLVDALVAGGHLVVGPTEGIHDMLAPLRKRSNFLYQKP